MVQVPVRLVRILGLEGTAIRFASVSNPSQEESLPLDDAYHGIAAGLPKYALCKATILNGKVIVLELIYADYLRQANGHPTVNSYDVRWSNANGGQVNRPAGGFDGGSGIHRCGAEGGDPSGSDRQRGVRWWRQ